MKAASTTEAGARMAEAARRWSLALTRRRSVTGTTDEAAFGPWLAERLREAAAFAGAEIATIPVGTGDPRHAVALLLRGTGGGRWC